MGETLTHRTFLLVNVLAAVTAATLMILLHELSHLVTGLILRHGGTLYAYAVVHDGDPSASDQVVMLLAGPAFSVVLGAVMQVWMPWRKAANYAHLVWLWLAFTSVQEGVAYLCLTPFGAGDTGTAAQLMGMPVFGQIVMCLVGVGGMFLNALLFAPHLAGYAGPEHRMRMQMSLFPWLYGMAIMVGLTLLYLAVTPSNDFSALDQIAVAAAGTVLFVFAPMANMFHRQVAHIPHEPLTITRLPVAGIIVFAALVVVNVLLSVFGLHVG